MLKSISFLLAFLFLGGADSKESDCETCITQDHRYFCASNTFAMNSRLCMDLTEVPSMVWKTFLEEMKADHGIGSEEYNSNIPDFQLWEEIFPGMTSSKISRMFMEEETFNLMPIVGVSYEQVLAFCKWREKLLQKELDAMDPDMRENFPKKFIFRLPTNKEWARIRFMTQEKKMLKRMDKMVEKNMKFFKIEKNTVMKNSYRAGHIYQTKTDYLGLYNIFDNVAEMTSERGIAMGGSWNEANEESKYDREFTYQGAQAWLGFRCIFEIVE
jgi:formylglycine-generating enzyme required for sulfatase activity